VTRAAIHALLFLGLLGLLAFADRQGWMVPGLSWAFAGIAGIWLLWSLHRPEQVLLKGAQGDQGIGEGQGLVQSTRQDTNPFSGMSDQAAGEGEMGEQQPEPADLLFRHLEELFDRVDLVARHAEALAVRFERVVAEAQIVQDRLALMVRHREDLARQMAALDGRRGRLAEPLPQLAEQPAPTRAKVDLPVADAARAHPKSLPQVRRSLPRHAKMRLAPQPAVNSAAAAPPPQPAPPQAAPPRPPGPPQPLKVQVTTYQRGEAPRQREINVRLGGQFF
jgi:hypothetical protein